MDDSPTPRFAPKARAYLAFVASAAIAATALHEARRAPKVAAVAVALAFLMTLPVYWARRRSHDALRSGDVRSVLTAWSGHFARLPYPETMRPLIAAVAFASCGWIDQARTALARSARGPAWEAALEHRLFVETLLDAFEGDREAALMKASLLSSLPLPKVGPFTRQRVRSMRDALTAFARAFAHASSLRDLRLLEHASARSPLVHWAMSYAAAVVAVDHGDFRYARKLLETAPSWPRGSAFQVFHHELLQIVEGD